MEIFCFFMGILFEYTRDSYLPLATLLILYLTPRYPIIFMFILGIILAWSHEWMQLPKGMPSEAIVPHALLQGAIASIPITTNDKTQFILHLNQINNQPADSLVQLAWYPPRKKGRRSTRPIFHVGQHWQFTAKIKKPRNFQNPGSFNFVNALAVGHIYWTGYITNSPIQLLVQEPSSFSWLALREQLDRRLQQLAPNQQTSGVVSALTLNLTNQISQEDWSLFRRTGTIHLFGISGEHIALVSGLSFILINWLWSRCPRCCLSIPAIYAASTFGLIIALLYSLLAGFAPPVQRALIGCMFYTLCCLGRQRFTAWQVWRYGLFGVLCIEPHAVFMQGFYFSFLAVACLLLTQQRWGLKGFKSKLALQLSCFIGLLPLTLYWFSYGSVNSFIANMFAIPLVGFLIVPMALMTLLIDYCCGSGLLMTPLSWLISLMFQGLRWIEGLEYINIHWSLHSIEWVIALLGALTLWVLLPIKPFSLIAVLWLVMPLFPSKNQVGTGEALIQVLDVGQGLAVTIRTQNHELLYDTGDQFFQGSDFGKMVILPFFQATDVIKIDKIVISHPDKDHRGGLKSVEEGIKTGELLVNDPHYYHRGLNCHYYPEWDWDQVHFRFLPILSSFADKNNNSCILQVSTRKGRVLLTGDIEGMAENYLVKTYGSQLKSDVLIVAHHGSKTSSSYRFILEVAPRFAIASLGFANRFHFPHAKTLATLNSLKIPFYRTDECGMVNINLTSKTNIDKPKCFSGLDVS